MKKHSPDKKEKQHCSIKCCFEGPKCALIFSAVLFGIVSLVHLYRIFFFFPVTIGTVAIAPGVSIAAFIVFGLLSIWMFYAAAKYHKID